MCVRVIKLYTVKGQNTFNTGLVALTCLVYTEHTHTRNTHTRNTHTALCGAVNPPPNLMTGHMTLPALGVINGDHVTVVTGHVPTVTGQ